MTKNGCNMITFSVEAIVYVYSADGRTEYEVISVSHTCNQYDSDVGSIAPLVIDESPKPEMVGTYHFWFYGTAEAIYDAYNGDWDLSIEPIDERWTHIPNYN